MTDAPLDPATFSSPEDDELVFDDIVPVAPPKKSRRAPAKGRAADAEAADIELPASAASDRATAEEPAEPPVPVPQPGDVAAGSTASEDAPPRPAAKDRGRLLLLAIVGLALFTSLMSLGGLIAVSRTLATAQAQRAQAATERDELARLPGIVAALDRASARLDAAAAHAPGAATVTAPPVSADDLHHALDALRLALANREPAGTKAVADTLHEGFNEIATRLDRIETQVARPAPTRTTASR